MTAEEAWKVAIDLLRDLPNMSTIDLNRGRLESAKYLEKFQNPEQARNWIERGKTHRTPC